MCDTRWNSDQEKERTHCLSLDGWQKDRTDCFSLYGWCASWMHLPSFCRPVQAHTCRFCAVCHSYTFTAAMFCRALHLGMGTNVETSQDVPIDESDANFLESTCLYGKCIAEQVLVHVNKWAVESSCSSHPDGFLDLVYILLPIYAHCNAVQYQLTPC